MIANSLPDVPKITRAELANLLVDRLGCSRNRARKAVDDLILGLALTLIQGGTIEIKGLGRLKIAQTPARTIRHPLTGQPVHVPARRTARFHISPTLRDQINGKAEDEK